MNLYSDALNEADLTLVGNDGLAYSCSPEC